MIKVLTSLGEVLKSVLTIVASDAVKQAVSSPDAAQKVAATVGAAISAVHIPSVVQQAAGTLLPHAASSYSDAELADAEKLWLSTAAAKGDVSISEAFAAGAAFAVAHASASVVIGEPASTAQSVANAIATATNGAAGKVLSNAVEVAIDVATGNTTGAAIKVASDVVSAVQGQVEATEHHPV